MHAEIYLYNVYFFWLVLFIEAVGSNEKHIFLNILPLHLSLLEDVALEACQDHLQLLDVEILAEHRD